MYMNDSFCNFLNIFYKLVLRDFPVAFDI